MHKVILSHYSVNGSDAIAAYRAMSEMTDKKEIERKREQLLKYCYKDTHAMVGLLYKLYEAVGITDYLDMRLEKLIVCAEQQRIVALF